MFKIPLLSISFIAVLGLGSAIVFADELSDAIDVYLNPSSNAEINQDKSSENTDAKVKYEDGDWEKYIYQPDRVIYSTGSPKQSEDLVMDISIPINISYGQAYFTDSKYKTNDEFDPSSEYINNGYNSSMLYTLNIQGHVNDSLYVNIDHDSERLRSENIYEVIYNSPDEDSFLRSFKLGNILVDFNDSEFVFFDNSSKRATGISSDFRKDNLSFNLFAIVNENKYESEYFNGLKKRNSTKLREYQYVKNKYFQIEPFRRYDSRTAKPDVTTQAARDQLVTFTSDISTAVPAVSYSNYSLKSVNIDPSSFEVFLDDQISFNDNDAENLNIGGFDYGNYNKLVQGKDYAINFNTGELTFFVAIGKSYRIYTLYKLKSGLSSDPSEIFYNNRHLVFLKFGENLNSDFDSNGTVNYDVYEIRSRYNLGGSNLSSSNISVDIYNKNGQIDNDSKLATGRFSIDYENGILKFDLREPFKTLLASNDQQFIYSQSKTDNIFIYSNYYLQSEFLVNSGTVNLSHTNIVPDSVIIKKDGVSVSEINYSVDYLTGQISFSEEFTSSVSANNQIEIKYQYSDDEAMSKSMLTGARAEYIVNKNLTLGGSILYSQDSYISKVPEIGSTPESILVGEIDAELNIPKNELTAIFKPILGNRTVPVDYRGYVEYARSVYNINTFGYGLIDSFDDPGRALMIKMSEKNWILSSPPAAFNQNDRTSLTYKYYKDPDDNYELKGEGFDYYSIDYAVKSGPYNIREKYQDSNDYSLVLDFDFNSADSFASIITSSLDSEYIDLSSLQYVEILYKSAGGQGTVNLCIEAGRFPEDSDGDGFLDTEDSNLNGILDLDFDSNIMEDRGFPFNPAAETATRIGGGPRINYQTKGDGYLTTEDINHNGMLDDFSSYFSFPSARAFVEGLSSDTVLEVDMTDTSWKKARIYLDRDNLSGEFDILRQIESIRVFIEATNNAVDRGVIYINSINFVMLDWSKIKVDGIDNNDSEIMKVSFIDSNNDSEYRNNSFAVKEKSMYEKLYGDFENSELNQIIEGAIEIQYDLSANTDGSIEKQLESSIDISRYKKFVFWINARQYTSGDFLDLYIGKNESNCFRYRYDLRKTGWDDVILNVLSESSSGLSYAEKFGSPDFSEIKYMKFEISGNTGRIWINNLYAQDPEDITGEAFYVENDIVMKDPVYRSANNIYFQNNLFKHTYKYVEDTFISPGRTGFGMNTSSNSFYMTTAPTKNSLFNVHYSKYNSHTDDESQKNESDLFETSHLYNPKNMYIPNIQLKYQQNIESQEKIEQIETSEYKIENEKKFFYTMLGFSKENLKIRNSYLSYNFQTSVGFTHDLMDRDLTYGSVQNIETDTDYKDQRNYYNNHVGFENKIFRMNLNYIHSNLMVIKYEGYEILPGQPIQTELDGNYNFPFYYQNRDFKFENRSNSFSYDFDFISFKYFDLEFFNFYSYNDLSFSDNENTYSAISNYKRSKSTNSSSKCGLNIPIKISNKMDIFNISYTREGIVNESGVPYEGEGNSFYEEDYGVKSNAAEMSTLQYNQYKYYPFYFLGGDSNFTKGRQVAEDFYNENIEYENDIITEYNNSVNISDSFNLELNYNSKLNFWSYDFGLKNHAIRDSIDSVPGQNIFINNKILFTAYLDKIVKIKDVDIWEVSFSYSNDEVLMITQNIVEHNHSPGISGEFSRGSYGINMSFDYIFRIKEDREFIDPGISDAEDSDYIYSNNIPENDFVERDMGYVLNIGFFKKLYFLKKYSEKISSVDELPEFRINSEIAINDYDYENCISPEPYDRYSLRSDFIFNIGNYTKLNLYSLLNLEKYYNAETGGIYNEVFSYETGMALQIIF